MVKSLGSSEARKLERHTGLTFTEPLSKLYRSDDVECRARTYIQSFRIEQFIKHHNGLFIRYCECTVDIFDEGSKIFRDTTLPDT